MRHYLWLLLLMLPGLAQAFSYTIELSEQQLQEKVAAMMPIEKKKLFFTLTISEPEVDLLADSNRIAMGAVIQLSLPAGLTEGDMSGRGQARITGSLRYEAKNAAFYLDNPVVEQLTIEQVAADVSAQAKKLLQKTLAKTLKKRPIYRLKDDDVKQQLVKSTLKSVTVKGDVLAIEVGVF